MLAVRLPSDAQDVCDIFWSRLKAVLLKARQDQLKMVSAESSIAKDR